jgi:hypothetical protein
MMKFLLRSDVEVILLRKYIARTWAYNLALTA